MSSVMKIIVSLFMVAVSFPPAYASIAIGRTRVVFNAENHSQSFKIKNNSNQPYLVQSWIEDEQGNKVSEPFVMLPPVQRIEANEESLISIRSLSSIAKLPQDRESVFYINVLEIPPKSSKVNQVQLAVQSHIKLFYRPSSLKLDRLSDVIPGVDKMIFSCFTGKLKIENPTAYFITLPLLGRGVMISPKSFELIDYSEIKDTVELNYINDYGVKKPVNAKSISGGECGLSK